MCIIITRYRDCAWKKDVKTEVRWTSVDSDASVAEKASLADVWLTRATLESSPLSRATHQSLSDVIANP